MVKKAKYIFVTGGVSSSLGKGIIASSLGKLLQSRGFSVTIQKLDPYINIDPGTMNPKEHGECFVTEDGAETDLDLGHYERFLNIRTSSKNNFTAGRVYRNVIKKERQGAFLGKTVQVIPHITDEIKHSIRNIEEEGKYDIIITEIGGTVGDIESLPFIEAIRQMKYEANETSILFIHLTLVPFLAATEELKTKPTQHSVKRLLEYGIQPDILVCRADREIGEEIKNKIALFCNVTADAVIESTDCKTIYEVPLLLGRQKFDEVVLKKFGLKDFPVPDLTSWKSFLEKLNTPKYTVKLVIVGKYFTLKDSYKSILESILHAGAYNQTRVELNWLDPEKVTTENVESLFEGANGLLVAPGFGKRGIQGKLLSARFSRKNNIPFFGICLGLQVAILEFAEEILHLKGVNSSEFDEISENQVITVMEEQKKVKNFGGTMRLGLQKCILSQGSKAMEIYKKEEINERHRHRYEFNNEYLELFETNGWVASGKNPETGLVEIMEYTKHPWYIGVQFHPEYSSTVETPHPLFMDFVKTIKNLKYRVSE